jgi:serine/threonine-protein kinase
VPIEPGIKLGSYEVQEFIGQGAMGLVYRAYHAQLERFGAVKVLQGIASGPDAAARFRHEAQAIAQMRHPNIVNVYDFGEYEGTPYMIVEYVSGGNLAGVMQQTPLDQSAALRYLRGIAAGLDYAHSLGIVHRDVKPGNVLLEKDGTPVLADFGLVKLLQGSSLVSMTGVTTGTPAYMAPEQVTGHQVGPAADLYALATMAYEMLTGVIPFDGEGVLELLYAHVHREPPAPSTRNPALSASVDAVILRGLAKAPEARWESAAAMVDALSAALAGGPAPAPDKTVRLASPALAGKKSLAATAAIAMPSSATTPGDGVPGVARRRRRLYEIVAGAVILLLLLVIGGLCAAANLKPTLSLDPTIAVPGDTIVVIASRLPANQPGQIQLHSDVTSFFAVQSDAQGEIHAPIKIPDTATTGYHQVWLCWDGSCPLQKPLRIVAPGSLPGPTPSSSASPSPSPSASGKPPVKPTPGKTPTPQANPGATPTSAGHSPAPKPTPSPSPKPSPSPQCPFSGPALTESPDPVLAGQKVTVSGTNFKPGAITLTYYAGASKSAPVTATAGSNCTFSRSITTKGGLLLGTRADKVVACDSSNRCATVTFTAKALL